jgi:hypothetical protein
MRKLRRIVLPITLSTILFAGLTEPAPAAPTWVSAHPLSATGRNAVDAQVAANASGTAVAVWQVKDDADHWRVQAARRPAGGSWHPYATLSAAGQSAVGPEVVIDDAAGQSSCGPAPVASNRSSRRPAARGRAR